MMNFNTIPLNLLIPGAPTEITIRRAQSGLSILPRKILLMGQRINGLAGSIPVRVTRAGDGAVLFGRGSMLAAMVAAALKANAWMEIWAIGLDDKADGVKATATLTVNAGPTASGIYPLWVHNVNVPVGVTAGDTAAATATKIAAAINADLDLHVTAAAVDEVVTVTARHKGLGGNEIDIRAGKFPDELMPAGLAVAIVAMSGGAGNPDVLDAIEVFGDTWWTDIAMPWTDTTNLNTLRDHLESRWTGMVMKDCVAYAFKPGSFSALATFVEGRNNALETIQGSNDCLSAPWTFAATYAALAAFYIGEDPALPVHKLKLPGISFGPDHFTDSERNLLLAEGLATCYTDLDGTVYLERCRTTYKRDASGAVDNTFSDIEPVWTAAMIRYTQVQRLLRRFWRFKITDNGNPIYPGQNITTPDGIAQELDALAIEWQRAGLIENVDDFVRNRIVERAENDPDRVNILNPPNLVNQLRIMATKIEVQR